MDEIIDRLSQIRGLMLMGETGKLYILSDFEVVRDRPIEEGIWFKKTKYYTYINRIILSIHGKLDSVSFLHTDSYPLKKIVNSIIDDRNRYLNLQRSLNVHGLVIKKKPTNVTNK